jgi:hypothetical protein
MFQRTELFQALLVVKPVDNTPVDKPTIKADVEKAGTHCTQ